jgi:hypothetical protein
VSNFVEIMAIVEGRTEQIFIQDMVGPFLATQGIYMRPVLISKPGQKGGDVKFARAKNDIGLHLKQRKDTFLTLFVDYYGLKSDWPGREEAKTKSLPGEKAEVINNATKDQVNALFADYDSDRRFIPYICIHEFEALLFSEPAILASRLHVPQKRIDKILSECKAPEKIDDSPDSAPSKRLESLSDRFKKTTTGIAVAKAIGLPKIRAKCPVFDAWLTEVEKL